MDVTFHEKEPCFSQPYLQGENSREDKENLLLVLDLSLLSTSKDSYSPSMSNHNHIPKPVLTTTRPKLVLTTIFVSETESKPMLKRPQTEPVLENLRFGKGKVFTRKRMAILKPMQVQSSNLEPLNEVILPKSSLQNEIENESQMDSDNQNLPITIKKGTIECTKQPLCLLQTSYLSKNSHHHIKPFLLV